MKRVSPNIKDLLTSFSPWPFDFWAVSSSDGRIKIWDTIRGRLQIEFTNLAPVEVESGGILESKPVDGHLSIDYTCMEWVALYSKKKKKNSKPSHLLLVLGTGSGDLIAVDVSSAQLKWKVSDCHPGGVTAIAFSGSSYIYTSGVDGVVCLINSTSGDLIQKFQISRKAISSLAVSTDGKMFATASAQLKVFSCSDSKKIQKFFGHPVGVRCMSFSEDGQFIISSGIGEKYITFWKIDGSKNHSSCCVVSIEHPAISLDCRGSMSNLGENNGLYLLAISEVGLCYFWHGKDIKEMRCSKATKISVSSLQSISKKSGGLLPLMYSAKFQNTKGQAMAFVLVAYGSIVKPSFEKLTVQYGIDVNISCSQDNGFLLAHQYHGSNKDQAPQAAVTALDRANAEDAVIPLSTIFEAKKRKHDETHCTVKPNYLVADNADKTKGMTVCVELGKIEDEDSGVSMEDKLKSVGILSCEDVMNSDNYAQVLSSTIMGWNKLIDERAFNLDATMFKKACLLVHTNRPVKKIKERLLLTLQGDAMKLLLVLIVMWKTRSAGEQNVVSWMCYVLVNHGYTIMSQESSKQIIEGLHKMTLFSCSAAGTLLRLSGCLQLIMTQIIKAEKDANQVLPSGRVFDESGDEGENIDEVVYGEEETTFQSSDEE